MAKNHEIMQIKKPCTLLLPKPVILFSPRPVSELDAAATMIQKVYKSYMTRRNLADCAVIVEYLWTMALDLGVPKRSSVSFFNNEKPETALQCGARARTRVAKIKKPCTLLLPKPVILLSPRPVSELDAAATMIQKVYKGYRTRRKFADWAVVVEELWWKDLHFAALKRSSVSFFDNEKPETALQCGARARTRVAKVRKGLSTDENAQELALQRWLEAIDPRHRYGHNLLFYYYVWFDSKTTQAFFYWLDVGDGKYLNLERCLRTVLQRQCIVYLGPKEREAYEVIVESGKLLYRQTGMLINTVEGSKWIFVLSTTGALYVGQKKKGVFQHSSFLSGGATSAAGRLVAHDGVLEAIWPSSGHYLPTGDNFRKFISFLEEHQVDLTNVKIDPRHRYGHNLHLYYYVWSDSESTQPFFYWLDVGDGKDLNLERCRRTVLQRQCIVYLGPKEREAYEVIVESGKLLYRQTGMLINTVEGSKWIFVLSTSRALYVGQKKKGFFQHSSFLSGGPTSAAGRLVAHDGVLEALWPYSGHYLPTEDNFREFISFLEEHQVDLTNVKRCAIDNDSTPFKIIGEESKPEEVKVPSTTTISTNMNTSEVNEPINNISITADHQGSIDSNVTNAEAPLFDMGMPMSCEWTSPHGPRIVCVRQYPIELQSQALEIVNLSPKLTPGNSGSRLPIPSPRPSPKIRVSPRLSNMGFPSPIGTRYIC